MRRVGLIIAMIVMLSVSTYAKIGIHLIPAKPGNKGAIDNNLTVIVDRIIGDEFRFELDTFDVVSNYGKTLKELENRMSGMSEANTNSAGDDYFIIPVVTYIDGIAIVDIRVMNSETKEVIFSEGISAYIMNLENELENITLEIIDNLKQGIKKEEDLSVPITVFNIKEDGKEGVEEAVSGMLFSGLYKKKDFKLIEKEGAKWEVQPKKLEFAGLVDREPLKKAKKISHIKLALEGTVVTSNKGLISVEIKLVNIEKSKMLFSVYRECQNIQQLRTELEEVCDIVERRYFKKTSNIEIVTKPSRADLYILGKYYGRTPIIVEDVEPGMYSMNIKKKGYQICMTNIKVSEQQSVRLKMKLKKEKNLISWDKTYGGSDKDWAFSIEQIKHGDFIVAGFTASKGAGGADAWVLKLDKNGDIIWDKTYGGSDKDWASSIEQIKHGGFIVAGFTASKGAGGADAWVLKLDKNGDIIWDKTYGGNNNDLLSSIQQIKDGGFIVAGATYSKGAGMYDVWVLKLDKNGDIIWDKTYGGNNNDLLSSIQQIKDGGFIVAGGTYSKGAGGNDTWVLRLDRNGDIIWDKTYGGSYTDQATSIEQTKDGGFIVAGATYSKGAGGEDAWVLKLDKNGDIIWDKTYGGSDDDEPTSIEQTKDGGFIIAGFTTSKGAGGKDAWVLKLDKNGDIIWDKTYGGSYNDQATSIEQTKDSGFIVAGFTKSKGAGEADAWVLKLDRNGNVR